MKSRLDLAVIAFMAVMAIFDVAVTMRHQSSQGPVNLGDERRKVSIEQFHHPLHDWGWNAIVDDAFAQSPAPCQWQYSFVNGVATATYCGNVANILAGLPLAATNQFYIGTGTAGVAGIGSIGTGLTLSGGVLSATGSTPTSYITWNAISTVNTGGSPVYVCGRVSCGDGGQGLLIPAFAMLRTPTGFGNGEQVTDGVTNGTTTITSATAMFTMSDAGGLTQGMLVSDSDGDIPAGTHVLSWTSPTSVVLTAAATGSHTGDTFTFTRLAAESPGYVTDLGAVHGLQWDPSQNLRPVQMGAIPQAGTGTTDSGVALNAWFDAVDQIAAYGGCGYMDARYYSFEQVKWYMPHGVSPCVNGSNINVTIQFDPTVSSPLFQEYTPGGTGSTGSRANFWWYMRDVGFVGSTVGTVCQFGDTAYNDAANGATLRVKCINGTLGSATNIATVEGFYNSPNLTLNLTGALRSPNAASDLNFLSTTTVSSATLGFVASDTGSSLDTSGTVICPIGTTISSVAAGVATLSQACSGTGASQAGRLSSGIGLDLVASVNNVIRGSISSGAHEIQTDSSGTFGTKENKFINIDFDTQGSVAVWFNGAHDFLNVIEGGQYSVAWLDCGAVNVASTQLMNTFRDVYAAGLYSWVYTSGLPTSTACPYTQTNTRVELPGFLVCSATMLPTTPVSGTTYTNTSGEACFIAASGQVTTGNVVVGGKTIAASGATQWSSVWPPAATFVETCTTCSGVSIQTVM